MTAALVGTWVHLFFFIQKFRVRRAPFGSACSSRGRDESGVAEFSGPGEGGGGLLMFGFYHTKPYLQPLVMVHVLCLRNASTNSLACQKHMASWSVPHHKISPHQNEKSVQKNGIPLEPQVYRKLNNIVPYPSGQPSENRDLYESISMPYVATPFLYVT